VIKESLSDSVLVIADEREAIYSRLKGIIYNFKLLNGNNPPKRMNLPFIIYFTVAERAAQKSGDSLSDLIRREFINFDDETGCIPCFLDPSLKDHLIEIE
jgi:hypothetical protein